MSASLPVADAKAIRQTKRVVDAATAAEVYARRHKLGEVAGHKAFIVKLRAMRELGKLIQEHEAACRKAKAVRSYDKSTFIALARMSFVASKREACAVCGKFIGLSQAHHLIPLAVQFERGFERPDHRHAWLCPTHHVAVHVLIGQALSSSERASRACAAAINDMESLEEIRRLLEIFEAFRE